MLAVEGGEPFYPATARCCPPTIISRHYYAPSPPQALLAEFRKWELRPGGEISFRDFGDTMLSVGLPASGRWQDMEEVWASWMLEYAAALPVLFTTRESNSCHKSCVSMGAFD